MLMESATARRSVSSGIPNSAKLVGRPISLINATSPFYYIDYCLAQTVSLEFWAWMQKDFKDAWKHYMAYTVQGGSRTFTQLLQEAGMESPFDEACLQTVCQTARAWLEQTDMDGIA